jgi:hypothetical protein
MHHAGSHGGFQSLRIQIETQDVCPEGGEIPGQRPPHEPKAHDADAGARRMPEFAGVPLALGDHTPTGGRAPGGQNRIRPLSPSHSSSI